jgi:hypothetical protein
MGKTESVQSRRLRRQQIILGTLWLVYGVYGLMAQTMLGSILLAPMPPWVQDDAGFHLHGLAEFASVLQALTLVGSALSMATGFALLTRRNWGRVIGIVTAILSLLKIPFGMALGVYTLWLLLPEAEDE